MTTEMVNNIKKEAILELLLSQKLEIVHLITINAVALRSQPDMGQLNNLQKALKLNDELQKIIENETFSS
jgi:hypothetical protein